jgi:hypothetical protein
MAEERVRRTVINPSMKTKKRSRLSALGMGGIIRHSDAGWG